MLVAVIYLIFISLGLPDSLLGSGWPVMHEAFDVPSSYAGYVSMTISFMTIISALLSPGLLKRIHTKWIVVVSIILTIVGMTGFSMCRYYWMLFVFAVPYGFGAGSIDSAINHYVADNYSSSVMQFLHCFYGVGAVISPNIMAAALRTARWNEGYRWTSYIQIGILVVCILSLPLWKKREKEMIQEKEESAGIAETLKVPGVVFTLVAFFSYCAGESTGFLWTSSYFSGTKSGMTDDLVASFGSLVFGGLMLGRLISGFISDRTGDKRLIRAGIALEVAGLTMVAFSKDNYMLAASGFLMTGTGMGPVFPSIQHMAPANFGKRYSSAVIGLQTAAAYVGSTFMPMIFGHIQQSAGIWIMPFYMLLFAVSNIFFLEYSYRKGTVKSA